MSNRKCDSCGSQLGADDGYWHEDYDKDVCDECYRDETNTCQICGEENTMPSDLSPFILVKGEFGVTGDRLPGIYRILERPFMMSCIIGSDSLEGGKVLFVNRLPTRDDDYDISGHICKACAKPYSKTFKEVYGSDGKRRLDFLRGSWNVANRTRYGDWLERRHVHDTINSHPEMLYDLECEPNDYHWQDCFRFYQLGDERPENDRPWSQEIVCRHKTWRDWLALEHRGIKMYFVTDSNADYGAYKWKTLSLRPEPSFRDLHHMESNPLIVHSYNLPTMALVKATYQQRHGQPRWYQWGEWHDRGLHASDLRAAYILAIERGAKGFYRNSPGSIHADGIVL